MGRLSFIQMNLSHHSFGHIFLKNAQRNWLVKVFSNYCFFYIGKNVSNWILLRVLFRFELSIAL